MIRRVLLLIVGLGLAASQIGSGGVSAETAVVSIAGTNNASLTIKIADATADLGSNLDPDGTDSNSVDIVFDYQGSAGNQGTYYIWKSGGAGNTIEVRSNKAWSGALVATENSGTATSMTILSGVLRYVEGLEPTSYQDCGSVPPWTLRPPLGRAMSAPE